METGYLWFNVDYNGTLDAASTAASLSREWSWMSVGETEIAGADRTVKRWIRFCDDT